MRGAPPAAVGVLALFAAACGGGSATAQGSPSEGTAPPAVSSTSGSARSTTASVSFGSPVPATATARATPTPRPSPSPGASIAARAAAPTPVPGPCTPADVSITTTADRSSYTRAETVMIRVELRNVGPRGCAFSAPGDFTIEPDPSTGQPAVFAVHLDCPPTGCPPLAPGQTSTYPIDWNQVGNTDKDPKAVPDGGYHARAAFPGYPPSTSAPFTITG